MSVQVEVDHDSHICEKACLDSHVLGCEDCHVFEEDGKLMPWLCKYAQRLADAINKARWMRR